MGSVRKVFNVLKSIRQETNAKTVVNKSFATKSRKVELATSQQLEKHIRINLDTKTYNEREKVQLRIGIPCKELEQDVLHKNPKE